MLRELKVSNLAILPKLSITFRAGLNVLTGETGAGKSILVDAIGLLAGKRASSEDVRAGEKMATVEAILQCSAGSSIWNVLDEEGIPRSEESEDEILIRRTVSFDGRSRVWVNGWQWNVNGLQKLAQSWIDISGQHGNQKLLNDETHTELLDEYCGTVKLKTEYRRHYDQVRSIQKNLEDLRQKRDEARQQKAFLEFQLKEFEAADLKPDEETELLSLHQRLSNGSKLVFSIDEIQNRIDGEGGVIENLGQVSKTLQAASQMDESLSKMLENVGELMSSLQETSLEVAGYRQTLDLDPAEVEQVDERLAKIQSIKRKYGTIEKAIEERERTREMLSVAEDADFHEAELEKKLKEASKELVRSASKLTGERKKGSAKFSKEVSRELQKLAMPQAQIRVEFFSPEKNSDVYSEGSKTFGPDGAEKVRFELAPNPGEGFRPLAKIASGGELSRVLLGMKSIALSDRGASDTTFLFDEIDTGIGGETSERVGIRLKSVSEGRQVLCVTHLAQIACYAEHHLRVQKTANEGRTVASVVSLSQSQQVDELARMIGGIEITSKALEHASELLKRGNVSH